MALGAGPVGNAKGIGRVLVDGVVTLLSYVIIFIVKIVMTFVEVLINLTIGMNDRFVKFSKGMQARMGYSFSKERRNKVGMMVVYAGLSRNPEEILGVVLIYSVMFSAFVTFMVIVSGIWTQTGFTLPLVFLICMSVPFILTWILFYVVFVVLIERRTASVEKVLPDVLTIISQNMIAGMTVYNSLWTAARPEFGPLAAELQAVARETLGGEAFEKSLLNMAGRIKSYKLMRAVKLMIEGMRSGGELPAVLQEIASDIRAEQGLYKRMSSQTTSQAIFILFALIFGAPLLFSASLQFISIFNGIYEKVGLNEGTVGMTQGGMISLEPLPISSNFFWLYALLTLFILGVFGALLIGLIKTGKLSAGVPLIPVLPTLSIIIFVVLAKFIESFFGGMMAM